MAITLNTSHPLYANIVRLYGVDGSTVSDAKGDTCTPNAGVIYGTGTYGAHFRTPISAGNSLGVALTGGFQSRDGASNLGTTFVVVNTITSRANRGTFFDSPIAGAHGFVPGLTSGGVAEALLGGDTAVLTGTGTLVGNGAHSVATGINGSSGGKLWVDGAVQGTTSSAIDPGTFTDAVKYLGGCGTGGYGAVDASFVWVVHFNKFLSDAEVADLHASLGANGAFGLVGTAGTTVNCSAGSASAAGAQASIQGALLVPCSVGAAAAAGASAVVTNSVPGTTVGAALGAATAAGSSASVGTFIQTDTISNNSGAFLANTSVVWTWTPAGRIGAMAGLTRTDGTGTTDANGRLAPGIAKVPGVLQVAVQHTSALDDDVFYQAF